MVSTGKDIADYRWTDFDTRGRSPQSRYPETLQLLAPESLKHWKVGINDILGTKPPSDAAMRSWLERIASSPRDEIRMPCPRVFISHRKKDSMYARRAAWLASTQAGVRFWLDVIDLQQSMSPITKAIAARYPDPQVQHMVVSFVQAAVIEMALVNCTHVLAVVTDNTQGSWWVPYEYGRIARRPQTRAQIPAGAWRHPKKMPLLSLPEYMWLAPIYDKGQPIIDWLQIERTTQWKGCPMLPKRKGAGPRRLPYE